MHTSFTGSARNKRNINLSGRQTTNPWANLPGSSTKTTHAVGTQNTLANAQADRARRQRERDRLNAARRIQRTWRGHLGRTAQKQKWREEWDLAEAQRMGMDALGFNNIAGTAYPSLELCHRQLQLILRFTDVRQTPDAMRLLFFGESLENTQTEDEKNGPVLRSWLPLLHDFAVLLSRQTENVTLAWIEHHCDDVMRLLHVSKWLANLSPEIAVKTSSAQFGALARLLKISIDNENVKSSVSELSEVLLSSSGEDHSCVYVAFASQMLVHAEISHLDRLLGYLSIPQNQAMLCTAVSPTFDETSGSRMDTYDTEKNLWLLSYLLFLRRYSSQTSHTNLKSLFPFWIGVVSALLSRCANDIALRIDQMDEPMMGSDTSSLPPLHPFIRKELSALAQQQNIKETVRQLRASTAGRGSPASSMAKPFANYAVALLRAFPNRALSIRMWLYQSSPPPFTDGTSSSSTIQYLWQAAQGTAVFQTIKKNHRATLSVLTEAAPDEQQIGRAPVSVEQISVWQEDWRVVILFMELYSFILKIMDDEEFFALDKNANFTTNKASSSSRLSLGALPLEDISSMTTFLKNLAFTLYWNAADLDDTNELEEMGGISTLFGINPVHPTKTAAAKRAKTLAGNDVSQAFLKDRVTALLRMLHERDARRKFLPEGHWLMTGQIDMHGFLNDVVDEEEKRQNAGDEESDDDEEGFGVDADDLREPEQPHDSTDMLSTMFGIRPAHTPRLQTSRYSEKMRKQREKARKRRMAESLVPRLEILRNLPFLIPFDTRVQIFRQFVYRDQHTRRGGYVDPDDWRMSVAHETQGRGMDGVSRAMERLNRHQAAIHRESVFEDAYDAFFELGSELKEPIQISFIDRFGAPEAGIDGGGVTKEFLMSVTGEAFDPNAELPMFVENEQHYLHPNPKFFAATREALKRNGMNPKSEQFKKHIVESLKRYQFLGRIVGKCMYEGILVDINFAGFFLLKWALTGGTTSASKETDYRASINDVRDYDEGLYQGLLSLKNYAGDVESDFGLNFTASDELQLPDGTTTTVTTNLIHDGSEIPVNNENRYRYIDRITRYRLQYQPQEVTNAFLKGLGDIIKPSWLAMFNQRELQKLVGGDNAELDIADLRRNTQYGGLYVIGDDGLEHPTVELFWKVLRNMNDADRRKVVKFVTSTPRAPLLGFSHLNPRFSIRDSSEDQTRLPSTSTCVNLLKLPRYSDEDTMREKLLYAVNSGAGFDLS